jgi:DNA-binding CsgD family transcriptional regulator
LPPAICELLGRLSSELAMSPAWREGGGAHVYRDAAAGVCVVLEPLGVQRAAPPRGRLSARELQIATMIAEGHSNKTIGYELGISIWTVSTHLRRIFVKLGVRSRAAMVGRLAEQPATGGRLAEQATVAPQGARHRLLE